MARTKRTAKVQRMTARHEKNQAPSLDALEPRRLLATGDFVNLITFGQAEEIDNGLSVVTDDAGNTYVAGTFRGRIDVDPAKNKLKRLYSPDGNDVFIAKYDSGRRLLWAKRIGGDGDDEISFLRLTPQGDLIVAGQYDEEANFGSNKKPVVLTGNGDREIYITKLNGNTGDTRWARSVGGSRDDFLTAVNVGPDGDVYYAGTFRLRADVDPGTKLRLIQTVGADDTLVSRLSGKNGSLKWFRVMGEDDTRELVNGIEVDAKGRALLVGAFNRELRFDRGNASFTRESSGEDDVFLARVNGNGKLDFVRTFGGREQETVADVAVGPDGAIHITGNFTEDADFDPGNASETLTALSDNDTYIAKYRPSGDLVWARQFGGEDARIQAKGVAVDEAGNVYAVGDFFADDTAIVVRQGSANIAVLTTDKDEAPAPVSRLGQTDVYLVKLDAAGRYRAAVQFGGPDGSPVVNDVAVSNGVLSLTGNFAGEDGTDFDPTPARVVRKTLDERGEADFYLLRLEA